MVFDYKLRDSSGRLLREGQIHIATSSPTDEQRAFVQAAIHFGEWLRSQDVCQRRLNCVLRHYKTGEIHDRHQLGNAPQE